MRCPRWVLTRFEPGRSTKEYFISFYSITARTPVNLQIRDRSISTGSVFRPRVRQAFGYTLIWTFLKHFINIAVFDRSTKPHLSRTSLLQNNDLSASRSFRKMKLRYSQELGMLNPLAAAHVLQHQLVACTSSRRRLEMLPSQSTDYINISVTSLSNLLQTCG
jgi:hypothetical protein